MSIWRRLEAARSWTSTPAGRRAGQILSVALSLFILGLLLRAIGRVGWSSLIAVLPTAPLAATAFWLFFIGQYLSQPTYDWLIFRPWWRLGIADIAIFLRKHALNETLFAYAGEGWLLAWAAKRAGVAFDPASPPRNAGRGKSQGIAPGKSLFADVKDVAITSELAGNLFTLAMLILAAAMGAADALGTTLDPTLLRQGGLGFSALLALNILILFNRGRLFSLPTSANIRSFGLHLARVGTAHALLVASWIVALPLVGISAWLLLGALRLVIARLPLPNKQLLFAAAAVSLANQSAPAVAALMAAQGVLTLAAHTLSWLMAEILDRRKPQNQRKS